MFSLRTRWLHHLMCARPWSHLLRSCGLNMHVIYGLWLGIGVCEFLQIFQDQNFWAFFLTPQIIIDFSLLRLNYSCKFFFLSVDNLFCKYNWESFQRPLYVKLDVFNGNYITTTISLSKQKSSVTSLSDWDNFSQFQYSITSSGHVTIL